MARTCNAIPFIRNDYRKIVRVVCNFKDYLATPRNYWASIDTTNLQPNVVISDSVNCIDRAEAIDVVWEFNTIRLLGGNTTLKDTLIKVRAPGYTLPTLLELNGSIPF